MDVEEPLDFEATLERLLRFVGSDVEVSVRAQGATIMDEVLTASGRLLEGRDLADLLRTEHPPLLDDRLRFSLDSGASFWVCRRDFLRASWWPANADVPAGEVLLITLHGCELKVEVDAG